MKKISAREDGSLAARVIKSTPLLYSEGLAPVPDRPAHIRAASGIVRVGSYLTVIQDDANFVALINSSSGEISAISLPAGEEGKRLFDDEQGNKKYKMDLESCALVRHEGEEFLIAFGSGSSSYREQILILRNLTGTPEIEVYQAAELYAVMRAEEGFAGSEMNIEGAVFFDGKIRLFNRGNGAIRENLSPVNATVDLDWQRLYEYLTLPAGRKTPVLENINRFELGNIDGLPLSFTDAAINCEGSLLFSAAAEDSPDALSDGRIAGSVLGVFDAGEGEEAGSIRWAPVSDASGNRFGGKIEGLAFSENEPDSLFVVIDQDSSSKPSELCEVRLHGPWF